MSLTSALRPSSLPFKTPDLSAYRSNTSPTGTSNDNSSRPFQHDPDYINLNRMLIRFQHLILLTPSSSADNLPLTSTIENLELLSPLQKQIQAELWSILPFHRTKWLRNIEGARTLLLRLERAAQGVRVARVKGQILRDLAEKRSAIKRLRNRVEEIGREVEDGAAEEVNNHVLGQEDGILGETVFEILREKGKLGHTEENEKARQNDSLQGGKPVPNISQEESQIDDIEEKQRDQLLGTSSSSNIRRRPGKDAQQISASTDHDSKTTGFSTSQSAETALLDSSRTQETLTASLVSMAAQLKQQSRAFQFALDQDKGILDLALEGLDKNLTGMEAASKNMAFLKRMSEGEGWLGRLKLYALILGLWVIAILLVFVGPKLRF